MNRNTMIAIGAILVIVAGLVAIALNYETESPQTNTVTPTQTTEPSNLPETSNTPTDSDVKLTITFTDGGFDKTTYTVGQDQNVLVKNSSNSTLEFSSDEHPTHLDNPELNMRELNPGEEGTFQVSKSGTWKFHDHIDASKTGTLIVTQ